MDFYLINEPDRNVKNPNQVLRIFRVKFVDHKYQETSKDYK